MGQQMQKPEREGAQAKASAVASTTGTTSSAANDPAIRTERPSSCPVRNSTPAPVGISTECPASQVPEVYDVYGQRIDPRNQMPATANQQPWPGQQKPLPTERVQSNIPKGGTDGTWLYPSPQMFYNAIMRKGKGTTVQEDDMVTVVAIHNNMNERTWAEIMRWERIHKSVCESPKLLKFMGRDLDLSPKAYLKHLFGWPKPFDRHDWIVDRCGTQVRYIIDYYYSDAAPDPAAFSKVPTLTDLKAPSPVTIDARPAIDNFASLIERVRFFPFRTLQSINTALKKSSAKSVASTVTEEESLLMMRTLCSPRFHALAMCSGAENCALASTQLNLCLAENCPDCKVQAEAFRNLMMTNPSKESEEKAFLAMADCVKNYAEKSKNVK